ncbi:MAG: cyclic nucleotide-binding domain-containing protein [Cyanobacteriota bacterium]
MTKITIKKYIAGDVIIKEGKSVNEAYILKTGKVEVYKRISKVEIVSIATLGEGQIFGEMSLFGNKKSTASVKALTNIEVQVIDKKIFEAYLDQTPVLIQVLLEILAGRVKRMSDKYMYSSDADVKPIYEVLPPDKSQIDFQKGKILD